VRNSAINVLLHKKLRKVAVGPNATWCFEDRIIVQYQVQEMLRIEKDFRGGGDRGGTGRLQPADPGRTQLEGDDDDRVCG